MSEREVDERETETVLYQELGSADASAREQAVRAISSELLMPDDLGKISSLRAQFRRKLDDCKNQLRSLSQTQLEQARAALQKLDSSVSSVHGLEAELRSHLSGCVKTTMDRMHLVEDSIRRITLEYVTDYDLLVDLERVRKNVDDTRSGLQRLQDLENEVEGISEMLIRRSEIYNAFVRLRRLETLRDNILAEVDERLRPHFENQFQEVKKKSVEFESNLWEIFAECIELGQTTPSLLVKIARIFQEDSISATSSGEFEAKMFFHIQCNVFKKFVYGYCDKKGIPRPDLDSDSDYPAKKLHASRSRSKHHKSDDDDDLGLDSFPDDDSSDIPDPNALLDPDADSYHSEDFGLVDNSDLFDMADDVHNPVNVLESKPVQPTAHPPTRETSTASIYSPVTQKGTSLLNEKGGPLQNVLRGTRSRSHSSTDVSSTSKNVDARFAEDALLREFNAGDVDFDNFDTDEEARMLAQGPRLLPEQDLRSGTISRDSPAVVEEIFSSTLEDLLQTNENADAEKIPPTSPEAGQDDYTRNIFDQSFIGLGENTPTINDHVMSQLQKLTDTFPELGDVRSAVEILKELDDDLFSLQDFVVPCFPPSSPLLRFFVEHAHIVVVKALQKFSARRDILSLEDILRVFEYFDSHVAIVEDVFGSVERLAPFQTPYEALSTALLTKVKNQVRSWLSKAVNRDIEKASRNDPKNDLYSESSGGMGSGINSLMAVYCLQILIQQIEAVSKQLHQGNVIIDSVAKTMIECLIWLGDAYPKKVKENLSSLPTRYLCASVNNADFLFFGSEDLRSLIEVECSQELNFDAYQVQIDDVYSAAKNQLYRSVVLQFVNLHHVDPSQLFCQEWCTSSYVDEWISSICDEMMTMKSWLGGTMFTEFADDIIRQIAIQYLTVLFSKEKKKKFLNGYDSVIYEDYQMMLERFSMFNDGRFLPQQWDSYLDRMLRCIKFASSLLGSHSNENMLREYTTTLEFYPDSHPVLIEYIFAAKKDQSGMSKKDLFSGAEDVFSELGHSLLSDIEDNVSNPFSTSRLEELQFDCSIGPFAFILLEPSRKYEEDHKRGSRRRNSVLVANPIDLSIEPESNVEAAFSSHEPVEPLPYPNDDVDVGTIAVENLDDFLSSL